MTPENKLSGRLFPAVCVIMMLVIVGAALTLIFTADSKDQRPMKAGCVFSGSVDEPGWNGSNYEGVKTACEENGFELAICENVPETQCMAAAGELVSQGCRIIFLTSYGYAEYADELAAKYPDVRFCVNGSEYSSRDVTFYFARMYQGRYLAGVIAGLTTKTNVIGYVAAMSNNEVNRGINAFALGVKSINPYAKVVVRYTGSWDDPQKERESVKRLSELDADVIAYQQNQENVPAACDEAGINFIGCYGLTGEYSEHCLTSILCRWDRLYGALIRDSVSKRLGENPLYWLGIQENAIELDEYSENVSVRARYEVTFAIDRMRAGKSVFSGEIYDSGGNVRCAEGEVLSDISIISGMDWLVEGVTVDEA